ncbi:MAG: GAF domain-containing protein [Candidatus Acidiferrales bacterium]
MNSEEEKADANAIIPEDRQGLATRSPALISRGLRDLTGSLDSILIEMGKALHLGRSPEEAIGEMIEKAHEVFRSETYYLFLMDSEKGDLYGSPLIGALFAGKDFSPTHIKVGEGLAEVGYTPVTRTGEGLVGWVARTGQLVVVPDTSKDSRFDAQVDGMGTTEARSIVAAPVRLNDRCLGVIELINCVGAEGFSRRNLMLLEALADFAAIAIENSRHVQAIHKLTITDDDTSLENARALQWMVNWEISRSLRGRSEFSLIWIDLNLSLSEAGQSPWKDFHDVPVGAWLACLKQVGQTLKASCRLIDLAYRCSDSTFAILIPGLAEHAGETKEKACRVACDLSRQFGKAEWLWYAGRTVKLPACIGVVSFPNDATTKDQLFQMARETTSLVSKSGYGGVAAAGLGVLQLEDS